MVVSIDKCLWIINLTPFIYRIMTEHIEGQFMHESNNKCITLDNLSRTQE